MGRRQEITSIDWVRDKHISGTGVAGMEMTSINRSSRCASVGEPILVVTMEVEGKRWLPCWKENCGRCSSSCL